MAEMTCEALVDEIQALTGRTGDTVLITDARCTRWLNEAQEKIVDEIPGLQSREIQDATSLYCVSDEASYSFASFCAGYRVAHPLDLWYNNGSDSHQMNYMPEDEFDEFYPDITSADFSPQKPINWTVKGTNIVVGPRPDSDYAVNAAGDLTGVFKFTYTAYAEDFNTTDATYSDITRSGKGLILYSVAEAWGAIGSEEKRIIWEARFNDWVEEYKDKNGKMLAWDNSILKDEL